MQLARATGIVNGDQGLAEVRLKPGATTEHDFTTERGVRILGGTKVFLALAKDSARP